VPEGCLVMGPWLIGYVALTFVPVLLSLYYSFTNYDVISPEKWVGLRNYLEAFTRDDQFWPSLGKTAYYAGVTVPLGVVGSLLLATFLNVKVRGTSVYRTFFFMPSLVPIVAAAVLWFWLLQADWGPVNRLVFPRGGVR